MVGWYAKIFYNLQMPIYLCGCWQHMQGVGESPLQTQFHSPANTELTHKRLFLFSIILYFLSIVHQNYSALILVDRNPQSTELDVDIFWLYMLSFSGLAPRSKICCWAVAVACSSVADHYTSKLKWKKNIYPKRTTGNWLSYLPLANELVVYNLTLTITSSYPMGLT